MNSSSTIRLLVLIAFLLVGSALSPTYCMAWSLGSQPTEGILVLRNGNILRGKLQKQGDRYLVHMSNGQLQVRESQVEMVCENLEEAYLRRREVRVGSTADSHFQLAAWCVRHDLFRQAEAELTAAEAIDPEHPRLAFQRRRLKHKQQMQQRNLELKLAALKAKQVVPVEPTPLDPVSLEKAPPWARTLFVRQIQPLLVNSCGATGCHQSGSEEQFQMNRLATDGAGHPGVTKRNLAALLKQIDWKDADQSSLLLRAKVAHGSLTASTPLPAHKMQVLEGWVNQLTESHLKASELRSMALLAKRPVRALAKSTQQTAGQVQQASYVASDPFDPAEFNRGRVPKQQDTKNQPTGMQNDVKTQPFAKTTATAESTANPESE